MIFETSRIQGFVVGEQHAESVHLYYTNNSSHLNPWEPRRPDDYHSLEAWKTRIADFKEEHERGISLRILAFQPQSAELVGTCFFTNISHGVFQACNLGYSISEAFGGQGLMTEIVDASVDHVFRELDLHRVMASYVPENVRSARVLEKLGFEKEGLAKSYLKIAGKWSDHVLTSKLNPNHPIE